MKKKKGFLGGGGNAATIVDAGDLTGSTATVKGE